MVIVPKGFNTYLQMMLFIALLAGCQSAEKKSSKQLTSLNLHVEALHELPDNEEVVSIGREHPFKLKVQKAPFLTQNDIEQASVIETVGGFALRIQFNKQGSWLLEQYSAGNLGKHFAVFSQFVTPPEEKLNKGRWVAAPRINKRLQDGVLIFTPDATRQEADQLVLGLNNVVKELKKKSVF
jgi:preprotein translocase subunit SecD